MIIGDRVCTITFDDYDKQALARVANIVGNISDTMLDDESVESYFADDLGDFANLLFKWEREEKVELRVE